MEGLGRKKDGESQSIRADGPYKITEELNGIET